jgi:TPR repeat protein
MKTGPVAVALMLVAGVPAASANDGVAAFRDGDYLGAARAFVGSIEGSLSNAAEFLSRKVERSVGTVETLIGDAYYYGHGVSRDYSEAVRMYRRGAEKGSAMAQSTLGDIYFYGRGAPQDFAEAVKWWTLAADADMPTAQLNLSVMLANGDGAPQDYVRAHMYANLAASRLPPGEDRETAVKNRDIVAKLMSREQLLEAQRLAREWRPRQAE